ncbi:hypothetical protein LOAG_08556 [Loa loa]|uniref:Uncharacterized protein n=1 Tax=Loa loa TaxID=7209 RepID=A0A1S0TTK2_LOALO|nr:hypothetical protein LOAG_08556 [Loa loa]EFO19938.1 hypothetical protein LOAG_08556 [Loa loa]
MLQNVAQNLVQRATLEKKERCYPAVCRHFELTKYADFIQQPNNLAILHDKSMTWPSIKLTEVKEQNICPGSATFTHTRADAMTWNDLCEYNCYTFIMAGLLQRQLNR